MSPFFIATEQSKDLKRCASHKRTRMMPSLGDSPGAATLEPQYTPLNFFVSAFGSSAMVENWSSTLKYIISSHRKVGFVSTQRMVEASHDSHVEFRWNYSSHVSPGIFVGLKCRCVRVCAGCTAMGGSPNVGVASEKWYVMPRVGCQVCLQRQGMSTQRLEWERTTHTNLSVLPTPPFPKEGS